MNYTNEFFVVGEQYENRKGTYTVVSIERDMMMILYGDGSQQKVTDIDSQQRIFQNIIREKKQELLKTQKLQKQKTKKPALKK
jgi:hypothetical protein